MRSLSAADVDRFSRDGYLVIEGALEGDALAAMQREADLAIAWEEARIRDAKAGVERISHLGQRYFIPGRSEERDALKSYVFGDALIDVARHLVGPDAYLFTELFVCKMPSEATSFGWHQDFGYLADFGFGHFAPNVTVWTALDDMREENGALRVIPFSEWGDPKLVPHHAEPSTGDRIADFGDHPGVLLTMPAGSIVALAGLSPHKSGPNAGPGVRRAHLTQFSRAPIVADGQPIQFAVPALVGGERREPVYDATTMRAGRGSGDGHATAQRGTK